MRLIVDDGHYDVTGSRWPLLRLLWVVTKHRAWHWWRGEGWRD